MTATYRITTDPAQQLVYVTLGGFFEIADVAALGKLAVEARAGMSCPPNAHRILIDCSDMHIQSQAVVAAFCVSVQHPDLRSRRSAVVVGRSLANAQARRIFQHRRDHVAFFRDREAAEAWLMAPAVSDAQTASRYRHAPALPMSADHGYIARSGA